MIPQRWVILALILLAQTAANIGPLGIAGLTILAFVRERPRADVFLG